MWANLMKTNFAKNGYPAVDAVRKAVEADCDWDTSDGLEELHFHILRAAQAVDRFEPFTAEERALNTYLISRMAGKRLCDYAWRMFSQRLKE